MVYVANARPTQPTTNKPNNVIKFSRLNNSAKMANSGQFSAVSARQAILELVVLAYAFDAQVGWSGTLSIVVVNVREIISGIVRGNNVWLFKFVEKMRYQLLLDVSVSMGFIELAILVGNVLPIARMIL